MDIVICALVDAFESRSLEHLVDHRMQVSESGEWCLTLAAFLCPIRLNAVAANDLVAALAVSRIDRDILAISTCGTGEHGIRTRVQLL